MVYSRGAGNNNLVTPDIHSLFTKSPYLSNYDLNVGGYNDTQTSNVLVKGGVATTNTPFPLSSDMYGGEGHGGNRVNRRGGKSKRRR